MARWRRMHSGDLPAAEALGSAYHVHHPEGPHIAPERLALAPAFCSVLEAGDGDFAGYCIAHPWGGAFPPGLDTLLHSLPDPADTLHIHDVVLVEGARRRGHMATLLRELTERAAERGLRHTTLIAVGEAGRYWAQQGFTADPHPNRVEFVRKSYGGGAMPMVRSVAAAGRTSTGAA